LASPPEADSQCGIPAMAWGWRVITRVLGMAVETVEVVEPAGEGGPVGLDCDYLTEGVVRSCGQAATAEGLQGLHDVLVQVQRNAALIQINIIYG